MDEGKAADSAAAENRTVFIAIAAMIFSTFCYLLGDTIVKIATDTVPVPQIIAVRGLITALLVASAAAVAGVLRFWPHMFTPRVLMRGGFDATTTLMFTHALAHMRIADATAMINAAPIAATVLAVFILGERVGIRRWLAILVGFLGMLLVLRPGPEGFNAFGLLALGAMLSVAGREVVTRGIRSDVPSLIVTLWSAVAVGLTGGAVSLATGAWEPLSLGELGILAAAAMFLFGAYHYSVVSLRLGEVSVVAPFRYTIILWGLIVGYIVWGDIPEIGAVAGMALIAASGLYVFHRELVRARAARQGKDVPGS